MQPSARAKRNVRSEGHQLCNVDGPPKERFHYPTSFGFWGAFDLALNAVTSVVDYDVQASKMLAGRL